jgi:hypothetical protein
MTTLHKDLPITKETLVKIIADIRKVYPESDAVYVAGTYARIREKPTTDKKHDVDLVIHFPAEVPRKTIESRNDDALWNKWSGAKCFYMNKPVIDFLFMFGKTIPHYGQHTWRVSQGLATPKILVWRKK